MQTFIADKPTVQLAMTTSAIGSAMEATFSCLVDSSPPSTVRHKTDLRLDNFYSFYFSADSLEQRW